MASRRGLEDHGLGRRSPASGSVATSANSPWGPGRTLARSRWPPLSLAASARIRSASRGRQLFARRELRDGGPEPLEVQLQRLQPAVTDQQRFKHSGGGLGCFRQLG